MGRWLVAGCKACADALPAMPVAADDSLLALPLPVLAWHA
jgi:hypothetical protein